MPEAARRSAARFDWERVTDDFEALYAASTALAAAELARRRRPGWTVRNGSGMITKARPQARLRRLSSRRIAGLMSAAILVLAAADCWATRNEVFPDGISYLDVGDTVFTHGFQAGANAYWSPAYGWLLGAVLAFAEPSRSDELLLVKAVNLAIVALVLAAFGFWLRELLTLLRRTGSAPVVREQTQVLLAYAILAIAVLYEITAGNVTPDLPLAAIAFTATGLLVRIARLGGAPAIWLALGVTVGIGYLVKAAFLLPAAVACLTCAFLTRGSAARRGLALVVPTAACVVVAAPHVIALSSKEGQLTLGESGALNYAWDVDRVTPFLNWQGGDGSYGRPVHPTRRIARSPPTFVYPRPVRGSVPVWYDPYYWYRGVEPRFEWAGQARALAASTFWFLFVLFASTLFLLLVPIVLLARPPRRHRPRWRLLAQHAYLAVPAVGILSYWPIHVRAHPAGGRYIAGYLVMLAVGGYALLCAERSRSGLDRRTIARAELATLLVAGIMGAYAAARPVYHVVREAAGADAFGTSDLRVAAALRADGIRPGNGLAYVGDRTGPTFAYWARLARARVVANVEDEHGAFWRLPAARRARLLAALRAESGARAIVTSAAAARRSAGWLPVRGTAYSYRRLSGR